MDKDFLKFSSFVAFMEAKKEAERDCSVKATEWQDTIPTIRRKLDPATEALLLSRIRMPEKPAFYFLVGLVVGVSFIIMATSNAKKRYDEKLAEYELAQRDFPTYQRKMLAKQRLGK